MTRKLADLLSWTQAVMAATLPWLAGWRPELAVAAAAIAAACLRGPAPPDRRWPWRPGLVLVSAVAYLALRVSPAVAAVWVVAAGLVATVAVWLPGRTARRPGPAELTGLALWAGIQLAWPATGRPLGWLAGGLVLAAAGLGAAASVLASRRSGTTIGPPSRKVRGTVSLRELVLAGNDRLPRSVPLELELRAGDSLAVLCDSAADGEALAATLVGRRRPAGGEISIDGVPMEEGDRLVALVAPGEPLLPGSLESNIAALSGAPLPRGAAAAVHEACDLGEVEDALGPRSVEADGSPLGAFHKMLLLVARVLPSHYRVLVVVDTMPWVNTVRGELWRTAVVRASVGRTAVWITADRALAAKADRVLTLRGGALRADVLDSGGGGRP